MACAHAEAAIQIPPSGIPLAGPLLLCHVSDREARVSRWPRRLVIRAVEEAVFPADQAEDHRDAVGSAWQHYRILLQLDPLSVRRIIFWQPFASPHQEAFLEAVAEQFSGDVILGVERATLPPERVAQGWREPKHVRVRVIDISKPKNHAMLAGYRSAESLHVFTGFFSHPLVWRGFHKLSASQASLAIYSEAPEQPILTGWIKRLRGRVLAWRWSRRFAFVLAVGGVGCDFFRRIGFAPAAIKPFGYYLSPSRVTARPAPLTDRTFRFVAAGQLVPRKGIDMLIDACGLLPRTGWHVDVYGDGPARTSLLARAASKGLSSGITFHATIKNDRLAEQLAAADCTVLPSRFDGWGAIVSESLGIGTPVICTISCGVASVVAGHPSLRSHTCEPTVSGIHRAMQAALQMGRVRRAVRSDIQRLAEQVLSPSHAASQFLALAG